MAEQFLFLSYKRGPVTTPVVDRMYRRACVQLRSAGVHTFFDQRSIEAGERWSPSLDEALARTTHFLAFVSIDYWLSEQCLRELQAAVARYEMSLVPRLLFVLADQLDPQQLAIGTLAEAPIRRIRSAGQINFLGPYDQGGRLVRLAFESPQALDDQLAQLIASIGHLTRA